MKFIKIVNQGTAHRLLLQIIGLGEKQAAREGHITVGQFKSGFKLAVPAATRRNWRIFVSSSDEMGRYGLTFSANDISIPQKGKIIRTALMRYHFSGDHDYCNDLPISLEAFPNWENAFPEDGNPAYPIVREFIANAFDEDPFAAISFEAEAPALAEPGTFAVYIEQTPEVVKVITRDWPKYFKMFETPIFGMPGSGAIYPKSSKQSRYFNDGYLVDCHKASESHNLGNSLFDYEACGNDLVTEMRTLKSHNLFKLRMAQVFAGITDPVLFEMIFDHAYSNLFSFEQTVLGSIGKALMGDHFRKMVKQLWVKKFGDKSILRSSLEDYNIYMSKMWKYKVVSLPESLHTLFQKAGIPDAKEFYDNFAEQWTFRDANEEERRKIEKALAYFSRIKHYKEQLESFYIGIVVDNNPLKTIHGIYQDGKIYIEETYCREAHPLEIAGTISHENIHAQTKASDVDILFLRRTEQESMFNLVLLNFMLDHAEENGYDISDISEEFLGSEADQEEVDVKDISDIDPDKKEE